MQDRGDEIAELMRRIRTQADPPDLKRAALDAEYGNASDRYENLSRQYRAPGPRTNIWTAVDEAAPLARPDATGHLRLR